MENIDTFDGVIIFTDLKDFTLKTSLLTQNQINKLLNDQDMIILKSLKKYNGTLIKTIGDSYMILFEDRKKSVLFAIEVQNEFFMYNQTKKIKLQEIEVRISMDYGPVNKKSTINGYDYFGDCVNLASRILSKTLENKIFITSKFYEYIKDNNEDIRFYFLGNTTFKGILYEVGVYEIIYKKDDIKSFDSGNFDMFQYGDILVNEKIKIQSKNIDDIIFKSSCINAVFGVQPFPFFDIYSSVTVYMYMLKKIAKEYNINLTTHQAKEILATLTTAIGSTLFINQTINGISKIGLVGMAGFLLVPLNFGTTYGIGKIINEYFYKSTKNIHLTNREIKDLFLSGKNYGIKYAKENKKEILQIGRNIKKDFIEYIKCVK